MAFFVEVWGSLGRYQGHFQTTLLVFVWDIFPGYVGKTIEITAPPNSQASRVP